MAPRAPAKCKPSTVAEDSISTASASDSPALKPKTEKAKVEKSKGGAAEKAKTSKKVEKAISAAATAAGGKDAKEKPSAGKDGKTKPVSGDEAEKLILQYLKEQNRPYSATEVSANLHGKVTKTLADRLLKELEQAGKIMGKATNGDKKGSQWVFWYLQDKADQASPTELLSMDETISTLRTTTVPALKSRFKALTTNLSTILSAPTTSELTILIANLQTSNAEKRSRISELKAGQDGNGKNGGKGAVTKEEAERVQKEYAYWKSKMGVRKRCFRELEGMLMEGMSRDEIWERVGIEDVEGDGG
ncbi:uncharacterized protein BP5553_09174 [Venustampulla echinocandica]|uniref:Homologous-pairing protein 2 winged helix domain-containing protein n=1 Tax=Venustampulla echinocandica TaxID=2656787 RepID=A0A370TC02_9HELO|nr:uncharacterized protein BP5553_09174 [Venustampulla echinocandica]RDL31772.1 hypothetical protein BP5553_09174 [Venustampulla echinocandica]